MQSTEHSVPQSLQNDVTASNGIEKGEQNKERLHPTHGYFSYSSTEPEVSPRRGVLVSDRRAHMLSCQPPKEEQSDKGKREEKNHQGKSIPDFQCRIL
jgi:hypothetical protein